jgi:hypothetical protein
MGKKKTEIEKHWSRLLIELGLAMERGAPPRIWVERGTVNERKLRRTITVGNMADLVDVAEGAFRKRLGITSTSEHDN